MTLNITEPGTHTQGRITSTVTPHHWASGAGCHQWYVTWWWAHPLTREQAEAAVTIAELVADPGPNPGETVSEISRLADKLGLAYHEAVPMVYRATPAESETG